MGHKHKFEAYYHPETSDDARELGIRAIELRKCEECDKEMVFIQVDNKWLPLFKYSEHDEHDILLA